MTRTKRIELVVLAVVMALLAYSRIGEHRELLAVEEQTAGATEEASMDETAVAPAQTTERGPLGSGAGRPTLRTSTGTPGLKDSRSGESLVEGAVSQDPGIAGPPVYYTDQADDAYGYAMPPNAELTHREFDILRVDWGPVSYVNEQSPGGYSTSITVAGSARKDSWYVSWGEFFPGENCQLYHFLTPGTTAYANAYCSEASGDGWRLVGRVEGGPVTSMPTPSGGTRLTATFDNRAIPPLLEAAGRSLHNLSAFTCEGSVRMEPSSLVGGTCPEEDYATSALSYRV